MANLSLVFYDYTIPNLRTINDNFRDAVPDTERMAGLSGGFDMYGADDAPSEIGRVNVTFSIESSTQEGMQTLLDAVGKLKYYGKQKLYYQPQGTAAQRWCYARVNSIGLPRGPFVETNKFQITPMSFQVPDPHWYENEATGTIVASGTLTSGTITHNGNTYALAKITLTGKSGGSAVNPTVARMVNGGTADYVTYAGTVAAGQSLVIDGREKSCTNNLTNSYDNLTFQHSDWMRLAPGANVLYVTTAGTAQGGTVVVSYYPTYI